MSEEYKIPTVTISGVTFKSIDIEPSIIVDCKSYTASEFNKAVEMLKQPQLNENQQIVLEWLKEEYAEKNLFPTEVAWLLFESADNGYFEPEEERAFENLNKLQEAQVLQAFASWVLDRRKLNERKAT